MANIHDLAREFLAKDGLKIRDTQKAGVFLFADWLHANGYGIHNILEPGGLPIGHHGSSLECMHPLCIVEREEMERPPVTPVSP